MLLTQQHDFVTQITVALLCQRDHSAALTTDFVDAWANISC